MRGAVMRRGRRIDYGAQFFYLLKSISDNEGLELEKEYKFLRDRRFRFDYAVPSLKIAFEYEGIFSKKSRHLTVTGYSRDVEKYNLAQAEGWVVIRATPIVLKKIKEFEELVRRIISSRKKLLKNKTDEDAGSS